MLNYTADIIGGLVAGDGAITLLLLLAFLGATSVFMFVVVLLRPAVETRRRIDEQLSKAGIASSRSLLARQEEERLEAERPVEKFFNRIQSGDADTLQNRLYRAGYFSESAPLIFFLIRLTLCAGTFFAIVLVMRAVFPGTSTALIFLPALLFSLAFIVLPSIVLDRMAKKREESCRRGFPDFMDMMIVCADAGMSLEAAAQRVADEIAVTHKALGLHLKVMVLEMRAGRALREAIQNLGERLEFAEAKTLAVLFKQSEELGTSLTQTLRVYSAEMRERRIVRAEEKANALPVKMVMPLGLCIFPVILGMVMLPLIIRMRGVFF